MKVFISQPMRGLSEDQILEVQQEIKEAFLEVPKDPIEYPVEFLDNYNHPNLAADAHPLLYLGESIELMSEADLVIFVEGWDRARGCVIEHKICHYYDVNYIYVLKEADGSWGFKEEG